MSDLNIIIVFAIILFARFGIRLISKYKEFWPDKDNNLNEDDQN